MYVLVRDDLPPGTQLAQAVHAATEYTLSNVDRAASTPTVVVLAVRDQAELLEYADVLCGWCPSRTASRRPYALFHEPDLGEHTALATISDGREFSRLPLAGAAYVN